MDQPKDHNVIARMHLSGTPIDIGTLESREASQGSVWFQTDDNPEAVYIKVAEAKLLIAALAAAIDYLEEGD